MGTTIRPEVSEKNKYWISKHRYYELKHFCMQYPEWKKAYRELDGYIQNSNPHICCARGSCKTDPVIRALLQMEVYSDKIDLLEKTAYEADKLIWNYLLEGVTVGLSYEKLNARYTMLCSKDAYYESYRRFFWLLSQYRK